jgi:uncharacterized RDD family membrane protein YckC
MQTAPWGSRCIAYCIDWILSIPLAIICYPLWKDMIRDGRSIGKGAMGLRVVKMQTGKGPGCGGSCFRNCCMSFPGGLGCLCVCFNSENRHMGDLIAGTMVIQDA